MPVPQTGFDQADPNTPLWTFDADGNLNLAGVVTTGAPPSLDGRSLLPGTPAGGAAITGAYTIYESDGSYPLRNTVTTSDTAAVIWVGPDAPTIGSGYAVNGTDLWIPTTT